MQINPLLPFTGKGKAVYLSCYSHPHLLHQILRIVSVTPRIAGGRRPHSEEVALVHFEKLMLIRSVLDNGQKYRPQIDPCFLPMPIHYSTEDAFCQFSPAHVSVHVLYSYKRKAGQIWTGFFIFFEKNIKLRRNAQFLREGCVQGDEG